MENEFYKTTIDLKISDIKALKATKKKYERAISSYANDSFDPNMFFENLAGDLTFKQPDLFYASSIFVSEGLNRNKDFFLRDKLIDIFKTPRHKFVDFEHDVDGKNSGFENPNKYKIVGHIYDSMLAVQDNSDRIPDEAIVRCEEDGKWFEKNSVYRDKALDILVSWVVYRFQFPELVDLIEKLTDSNPERFGVSMEVLFSDHKFRIGGPVDPTEDFNFDGNTLGFLEVRKGHPLAKQLQEGWMKGKNRIYKGKSVIRILGGSMIFSGMAITKSRANERSLNISLGSYKEINSEDKTVSSMIPLLEAVASKSNFDMSTCKIVNGQPDCGCLEKAIQNELKRIADLTDDLEKKIKFIENGSSENELEKRKLINLVKEEWAKFESQFAKLYEMGDDEEEDEEDDRSTVPPVKQAQRRIKNLYENSLDEDLTRLEIFEFLEEIEHILSNSEKEEN